MSRKITMDAIQAFMNKQSFNRGNTCVTVGVSLTQLFLHGSCIAKIERGKLSINPCGYATATTKERLNGLPNVSIKQRDFVWYLNGSSKPMSMDAWTLIE